VQRLTKKLQNLEENLSHSSFLIYNGLTTIVVTQVKQLKMITFLDQDNLHLQNRKMVGSLFPKSSENSSTWLRHVVMKAVAKQNSKSSHHLPECFNEQ